MPCYAISLDFAGIHRLCSEAVSLEESRSVVLACCDG